MHQNVVKGHWKVLNVAIQINKIQTVAGMSYLPYYNELSSMKAIFNVKSNVMIF